MGPQLADNEAIAAVKPKLPRKNSRMFHLLFAYFEERTVSVMEIELVLPTARNDWLKPDIDRKLKRLDPKNPIHAELSRLVPISHDLLEAVDRGLYRTGPDWPELEPWLRRSLSYFVKGHDAIPGHFEDGFDDDHREFKVLEKKLGGLLDHFRVWQRRHPPRR